MKCPKFQHHIKLCSKCSILLVSSSILSPIIYVYIHTHIGHLKSSAHTALAQPVWWCNRSDFRDSCEPDFSKEHCVCIGRLRRPCSAKRSLEMEEETDWSQISHSDQRSYIKIETLRWKNPTEIHNTLHEVCGDSVVDHSMVSWWASRFREGRVSIQDDPRSGQPVTAMDDTSVVIVSNLLEEDWRKSWRNCAWSKRVIRFCFQNSGSNIAEEKSRCKVGSASAEQRTESSSQEGHRRTAAALWGRRLAAFEQNCCHRWNMDMRFWSTTEISVLWVEACNFSSHKKMSQLTIES